MMDGLKYIFAQPDYINGIGNIYPVKLKDYDKFRECSRFLYISKNHFGNIDCPLLVLLFMSAKQLGISIDDLIKNLSELFSLVTHTDVKFISNTEVEGFILNYTNIIYIHNYDELRNIIMKQNLMFEQKIYKNKLIQEWAEKVIKSKQHNSANITIEDLVTTVKVYEGISYKEIMNYTIYQLYADFYRISKLEKFQQDSLFATVSSKSIDITHFAEKINMFYNPYDDLFVDSNKLNKLNLLTK